jgi:hypothetical protein
MRREQQQTNAPRLIDALAAIPAIGLAAVVTLAIVTATSTRPSYCLPLSDSASIHGILEANALWAEQHADRPPTAPSPHAPQDAPP